MKIYKIETCNYNRTEKNINFHRTKLGHNLWDIIYSVQEELNERAKKENTAWAIIEVVRIK